MNKKELSVSYTFLKKCALLFISLPLLCFFLGWLKWYWAVLSCLALALCFLLSDENGFLSRKLFKKNAGKKLEESAKLVISKKDLILIVWISAVFLIFCGIGRLWAQTDDCLWRNAIFRDMITHRWPVIYDRYDGALSYYIGAWLPAAFIGKLAYLFGAGTEAAFCVGNISFLIYYTFGMSILFLLLLSFFKTAKTEHIFLIVLGFIFFSGMDFAGNQFRVDSDQIEWWARTFQYSSFTTCMCWVYNQALIPWICTALLLHEKKVSDYVFIGMACLFAGPFPFIGYFVYCVALGIKRLVLMLKAKQGKEFAKEVFSISNICSILFIFPVVAAFLTSNTYMSSQDSGEPVFLPPTWCYENYVLYFLFLLIEFGIYALLIAKPNKKNYLFYVTVIQLILYPLFNVGIHSDLTMRASIPAVFVMYALCYQYILDNPVLAPETGSSKAKKQSISSRLNILSVTLILCLLIGTVTPGVEFARGISRVRERGINDKLTDYVGTLDQDTNGAPYESDWPPTNFVAIGYDDILFFKVFARR